MRCVRTVGGCLLSLALATVPALAAPDGMTPAAQLSAALGGNLDWDLGEAGRLEHPIDYSAIRLYPGRSIEYRRRVAQEMRLAAGSASRPTPTTSR